MVPDIVGLVIVVWVPGLINIYLLFNAEKCGPFEDALGAERGGVIFSCE